MVLSKKQQVINRILGPVEVKKIDGYKIKADHYDIMRKYVIENLTKEQLGVLEFLIDPTCRNILTCSAKDGKND